MAFRNAGTPVWIAPGGIQSGGTAGVMTNGQEFATADMKTPGAEMVVVAESERKGNRRRFSYS